MAASSPARPVAGPTARPSAARLAVLALAALALPGITPALAHDAPHEPVAAWAFDETAGTRASDATGRGHDGAVSGATWSPAGRHGGALCFDGRDDRVRVADAADLDLFAGMTLSAWVQPRSLGGWTTVVLKERAGGLVYGLYASDGAGAPPAGYAHNGADVAVRGAARVAVGGAWTHLAVTLGGGTLRLYVNGALVRSRAFARNIHDSAGPLSIGSNGVWGEPFDGCIDDLRVYARALTAAELAADAATPVVRACGNGRLDAGEACDDGNGEGGDGCRPDCTAERCGDGRLDAGERCDDGVGNSASAPGACRPDCTPPRCGDGVVDPAEACDDGFANSDTAPDACRRDCTLARCGDGVRDVGEACDAGLGNNDTRPGACRADCAAPSCGDGVVDAGEGCDDGAANSDAAPGACRTTCTRARCGDGVLDAGEGCDDGDGNSDTAPNACRTTCAVPACGDGVRDKREACDDGNKRDDDGCTRACELPVDPTTLSPPPGCIEPSASFCLAFRGVETTTELRALVGQNPLVDEVAASSLVCAQFYGARCGTGCPAQWNLLTCSEPPATTESALCRASRALACAGILADACPTPTLERCASPAFRSQSPLLAGTEPLCRDWIDARCESLNAAACPAASFEVCAPGAPAVAAECAAWTAERCDAYLATACPDASPAFCATYAAGAASYPAACEAHVASVCRAGWEARLCPRELALSLNATRCVELYDTLDDHLPAECRPWLQGECEALVGEQAQDAFEASGGCESNTVVSAPAGFDYAVVDSVSLPGRFDCAPSRPPGVHPHDAPFTVTFAELDAINDAYSSLVERLGDARVATCEEVADQVYFDWLAFKEVSAPFADDARRVFQLAYSPSLFVSVSAIGARALAASPGDLPFRHYADPTAALTEAPARQALAQPGGTRDRNTFVHITEPRYASALASFLHTGGRASNPLEADARDRRNASIATRIERSRAYWTVSGQFGPDDGWHWHQRMSQALRDQGVSDDELYHLAARRERFDALLGEHARVRANLDFVLANPHLPGALTRTFALQAKLDVLADELEALLVDADARGCFTRRVGPDGWPLPSACDWSPRDFVTEVEAAFEVDRAALLRRCARIAPTDFSVLAGGYDYLVPNGSAPPLELRFTQDAAATAAFLKTYLDRRVRSLSLLDDLFADVPEEALPDYSDGDTAGSELGDRGWFAAGYEYGASWGIEVPPDREGLCGVNARADAYFTAYVYVDDDRYDVLAADLHADVRADEFDANLEVLGLDVWNDSYDTGPGPVVPAVNYVFNVAYAPRTFALTERRDLSIPIFGIAGFDIELRAGFAGQLGLDVSGALRASFADVADCGPGVDVALEARARPFAGLDGFLELGVDLWVVELGVGGNLTLLRASMPVTVTASATTPGLLDAIDADLNLAVAADLELTTLQGELYVYAETFWDTYRSTFFTWSGPSWSSPLLRKNFSWALGTVYDYCNLPVAHCE